ncbi:MAG: hypothetical protein AAGI66_07100 [Cyanobacteria bacterium P01_H01_bin.74]
MHQQFSTYLFPLFTLFAQPQQLLTKVLCLIAVIMVSQQVGFAQLINDPAASILMNTQSGFTPVNAFAEAARTEKENKKKRADLEKTLKKQKRQRQAKNSSKLQPAIQTKEGILDNSEPEAAQRPVKARAVMVDIDSDKLNYDKDRDVYVATGAVHMIISEQNSELYTDQLTYDQNQNIAIAEGSVVIINQGQKTYGSYAKIDLTRQSALINDYETSVSQVRLDAREAIVNKNYVQYENGKIILTPSLLLGGQLSPAGENQLNKNTATARNEFVHDEDITALGNAHQALITPSSTANQKASSPVVLSESASPQAANPKKSIFTFKIKELDVQRYKSGFNRVVSRWPAVYAKNRKILTLPSAEFSFDQPSGDLQYLGPDIGFDADYGGFYYGPGWDFRAGDHGSIRFSPLISYGGGGRRSRGGASFEDNGIGAGIGGIVHYRDPKTFIDAGYSSRVGQPVVLANRKLGDGKTQIRFSANEDYINGFIGYERPGYGIMAYDTRNLAEFSQFRLDGHSSVGWYKDEFFPTFEEDFFVEAKGDNPDQLGRVQLQARLVNTAPLFKFGDLLDFGMRADAILSGYTNGDGAALLRGGPTMNIHLGDRYNARLQYYYAGSSGETPFVFDSYYQGRQNLVLNNAFKVNNFLTLGMRSNMSLRRDNATDSLFTGNSLFMLVGPKEVKMNLSYDVVRKRSYFGLSFFPGGGDRDVDFEKMRIFQPVNYTHSQ